MNPKFSLPRKYQVLPQSGCFFPISPTVQEGLAVPPHTIGTCLSLAFLTGATLVPLSPWSQEAFLRFEQGSGTPFSFLTWGPGTARLVPLTTL